MTNTQSFVFCFLWKKVFCVIIEDLFWFCRCPGVLGSSALVYVLCHSVKGCKKWVWVQTDVKQAECTLAGRQQACHCRPVLPRKAFAHHQFFFRFLQREGSTFHMHPGGTLAKKKNIHCIWQQKHKDNECCYWFGCWKLLASLNLAVN